MFYFYQMLYAMAGHKGSQIITALTSYETFSCVSSSVKVYPATHEWAESAGGGSEDTQPALVLWRPIKWRQIAKQRQGNNDYCEVAMRHVLCQDKLVKCTPPALSPQLQTPTLNMVHGRWHLETEISTWPRGAGSRSNGPQAFIGAGVDVPKLSSLI